MKLKKSLNVILCLALILVSIFGFSVTTQAEDFGYVGVKSENGDWYYVPNYNNNHCCVVAYVGDDLDIVVPKKIDGLKVTSFEWGKYTNKESEYIYSDQYKYIRDNMTSVSFASGTYVTTVSGLSGKETLKSVTLPANLESLGSFRGDTALKSITIPKNITEISAGMFADCTALKSVTFKGKVTEIETDAFFNCQSLKSITFPSTLKRFGAAAFEGCTSLTKVVIPDSCTDLGGHTFANCTSLKSVTLGKGLTTLTAYGAFEGCTALKSITIPANITEVWGGFQGCTNLTTVIFRGNSKIYSSAFSLTAKITIYGAGSKVSEVKAGAASLGIRYRSLQAPKWATTKRSGTTVKLSWKKVSGAKEYQIYRKAGSGSYKLIKTTSATSFKDKNLSKKSNYTYLIKTVRVDGLGNKIVSNAGKTYVAKR